MPSVYRQKNNIVPAIRGCAKSAAPDVLYAARIDVYIVQYRSLVFEYIFRVDIKYWRRKDLKRMESPQGKDLSKNDHPPKVEDGRNEITFSMIRNGVNHDSRNKHLRVCIIFPV